MMKDIKVLRTEDPDWSLMKFTDDQGKVDFRLIKREGYVLRDERGLLVDVKNPILPIGLNLDEKVQGYVPVSGREADNFQRILRKNKPTGYELLTLSPPFYR